MQWMETHKIYKIHEFIITLKKKISHHWRAQGVIYSVFPGQTEFRKAQEPCEGKLVFIEFQPLISEGMTELESYHL